jgi:single-strand DNA-binding protein
MSDAAVTLTGNLAGDPELRFTTSGRAVASFAVAVNRGHKDKASGQWVEDAALFMRCTAWGDLAANLADSLSKGQRVTVTGELVPQEWDDKTTGEKRRSIEVVASDVAASLRFATARVTKVTRDAQAPAPLHAVGASAPY